MRFDPFIILASLLLVKLSAQSIVYPFWPIRSTTSDINTIHWRCKATLSLKMISAHVVKTSVNVTNSSLLNCIHPDHSRQTKGTFWKKKKKKKKTLYDLSMTSDSGPCTCEWEIRSLPPFYIAIHAEDRHFRPRVNHFSFKPVLFSTMEWTSPTELNYIPLSFRLVI